MNVQISQNYSTSSDHILSIRHKIQSPFNSECQSSFDDIISKNVHTKT